MLSFKNKIIIIKKLFFLFFLFFPQFYLRSLTNDCVCAQSLMRHFSLALCNLLIA